MTSATMVIYLQSNQKEIRMEIMKVVITIEVDVDQETAEIFKGGLTDILIPHVDCWTNNPSLDNQASLVTDFIKDHTYWTNMNWKLQK